MTAFFVFIGGVLHASMSWGDARSTLMVFSGAKRLKCRIGIRVSTAPQQCHSTEARFCWGQY